MCVCVRGFVHVSLQSSVVRLRACAPRAHACVSVSWSVSGVCTRCFCMCNCKCQLVVCGSGFRPAVTVCYWAQRKQHEPRASVWRFTSTQHKTQGGESALFFVQLCPENFKSDWIVAESWKAKEKKSRNEKDRWSTGDDVHKKTSDIVLHTQLTITLLLNIHRLWRWSG